jgi:hypothetical protein
LSSAQLLTRQQKAGDVVRPIGQHQQFPGVTGKAFLGEGREFGQVVVGDQRPTGFAGLDRSEELLTLFSKAALIASSKLIPCSCSLTKASSSGGR